MCVEVSEGGGRLLAAVLQQVGVAPWVPPLVLRCSAFGCLAARLHGVRAHLGGVPCGWCVQTLASGSNVGAVLKLVRANLRRLVVSNVQPTKVRCACAF
jgi:hypothetical protein